MSRITELQFQMLHDMMEDDNPDDVQWLKFDPPFGRATVAALKRRNLIRVKNGNEFQLTPEGRAVLSTDLTSFAA